MNDHEDLVTVSYAESWLVRYLHHIIFYHFKILPTLEKGIANQLPITDWQSVRMFIIWILNVAIDRPQEKTLHTSTKWCIPMIGLTQQIIKVIHKALIKKIYPL